MKIEFIDNKIILYLYQYRLSFDNKDKLNKEIKTIFLKLIKKYQLDLFGFNKVSIYENKIYGCIIEIENIGVDNYFREIIDLKIEIYNSVPFVFEFDDDYFFENLERYNNKYYKEIKSNAEILKYIEYGKIIYKK